MKYTRYVISHAEKGVKGGPYEHMLGPPGTCAALKFALSFRGKYAKEGAEEWLKTVRATWHQSIPRTAHAVPVVRKSRPRPSEGAAVAVLRELLEIHKARDARELQPLLSRARAVLAGAAPDTAAEERAAVVAYLREYLLGVLAEDIERGHHRKKGTP